MPRDRHYSDDVSHYFPPHPGIEPILRACQVSMLPTQPPDLSEHCKHTAYPLIVTLGVVHLLK